LKTQKVTQAFTATSTATDGLSYGTGATSTLAFIAADRGCLPAFIDTATFGSSQPGTSQSTSQQLLLGSLAGSTYAGLNNDYFAILYNLCYNYGQCCFGNLCNKAQRISHVNTLLFVLFIYLLIQ
jgi:hypothetical protein